MMDERVRGDHGPITGLDRSQAIVVVLETADAELLVQQPDRVDDRAPDQQAEPDQAIDIDAQAFVGTAPVPRESVQVGQAVVRELDLLRPADEIRARADQPDRRIAVQRPQQPEQPARRHDDVIIQQQDLAARSRPRSPDWPRPENRDSHR